MFLSPARVEVAKKALEREDRLTVQCHQPVAGQHLQLPMLRRVHHHVTDVEIGPFQPGATSAVSGARCWRHLGDVRFEYIDFNEPSERALKATGPKIGHLGGGP